MHPDIQWHGGSASEVEAGEVADWTVAVMLEGEAIEWFLAKVAAGG